jgi:hypothetical protein
MKLIKWRGLISLQDAIATAKSLVADYQEGKIAHDVFKVCIRALYQSCNLAQLVSLIVAWAKTDANVVIKLGLIDNRTLTYYSQKENMQKLRVEIKELSGVLKEAGGLLRKR